MTVQELVRDDASFSIGPAYPQLLSSLSGWFRGRGVPAEEAKDLAQETVVRTLVHLKRHGQRGDDLKPLAFTIARNLLTERARRGYGNVVTLTDDIDIADPSPTPLDTVMQSEERSAVSDALSALGSRHRRVIELWMKGETPADIARTLGIKRNAADALLHRARRRLASVLRESGQAFGGFIGLWGLRLRRAAHAVAQADPGALFMQAASAVAAVSVAGAIAVGGAGATTASHIPAPAASSAVGARHITQSILPAAARAATSKTGDAVPPVRPGLSASVADRNASAVENLPSPDGSTPIGIQTWSQPGGHTGHTEAVLNTGVGVVCSIGCQSGGNR